MSKQLLSVAEVSEQYGLSRGTVGQWVASGELPAIRSSGGGRVYVEKKDLDGFLQARKTKQAEADKVHAELCCDAIRALEKRGEKTYRANIVRELQGVVTEWEVRLALTRGIGVYFAYKPGTENFKKYRQYGVIQRTGEDRDNGADKTNLGPIFVAGKARAELKSVPADKEPGVDFNEDGKLRFILGRPIPPKRRVGGTLSSQAKAMPFGACVYFADVAEGRRFAKIVAAQGFSARTERADGGMYVFKVAKGPR